MSNPIKFIPPKKINLYAIFMSLFCALSIMTFMSCSKKTSTPKGREFTLLKKGDGNTVKSGQVLVMDLLFQDATDSVWYDTHTEGLPMFFAIKDDSLRKQEEGVEDIFRMLSKGDSISFDVTAKTLFEKMWHIPAPPQVDTTSIFTFYVDVKDVVDKTQMETLREDMITKRTAKQLEKDIKIIDEHLAKNNIQATTTPSGLRYQILQEGVGEPIKSGQKVNIHYAGYLINGTLFDTSVDSIARANNQYTPNRVYEPITFTAGAGQVIAGWDEFTLLLKKGSKAKVWIPSSLAYGPRQRSELIGRNSILVFNMEVMDVE